jgi:DNA helicase HerA-like ATPase
MTSFGPTLLSKVLGLNDTQESSLELVFHFADKAGLALLDLKDLQAVIRYLASPEGKSDLSGLGGLSPATAGVIRRELIGLSDKGGEVFFGEPEWETKDLLRASPDGKGVISSIELSNLQHRPQLFSTFLMWLLADLFHRLPEVGDLDKPKLMFFFDEAHLLFDGASKAFLDAVTQTVRRWRPRRYRQPTARRSTASRRTRSSPPSSLRRRRRRRPPARPRLLGNTAATPRRPQLPECSAASSLGREVTWGLFGTRSRRR